MMRLRTFRLLLTLLVLGIFLIIPAHASAQTDGVLHVINLSDSGFEQAHAVSFSPDGKFLAVGGTSGVYLVDVQKLSPTNFIQTNTWAHSVAFVPGSNILAAGLLDHTIKFWNMPEAQLIRTIDDPQGWVRSISFSADGALLASASDDNTIRIWQMEDGKSVLVLDKNTTGLRAIALSPDGKLVAGALRDTTVRVWSIPSGELLYTLRGHEDWVRCLAFSSDGKLLASGSFDKTVRLWDISKGELKQALKGHSSSVLGVAFSPDGKTLASGSVDETVRLWHVSDGSPIRVLQGHTDFVYAVAFSPDGQTLASGGGDNTVRLWDMNVLGKVEANTQIPTVSTPSDCRVCHHARGQGEPPRVIELRCEGCHPTGANLEWCPAFPRSPEAVTPPVSYSPYTLPSGVPVSGKDISVLIASPSNGETLYAGDELTAAAYIVGQVLSDKTPVMDLQVRLDIWSNNQNTATVTTVPSPTGQFKFSVSINPQGAIPYIIKPGGADCVPCHEDFRGQATLPNGDVRLVVTLLAPNGEQASDERWIKVDASGSSMLPIKVIDSISHEPLPGITVQANTVLYEWRARFGHDTTQEDGTARLDLDQLSQFPTLYTLSIPPTVYHGELYSSDQPVTVELRPNTNSYPTVNLTAHALSGQINGALGGVDVSNSLQDTNVWAIQLPAGPAYQTSLSSQNTFAFNKIPVSQYIVAADNSVFSKQGLYTTAKTLDLLESPRSSVSLLLAKGRSISGKVMAKDGRDLPFAWITIGDSDPVQAVDPTSSTFSLFKLPRKISFITITAPGYYSLPLSITESTQNLDVQLTPRPESRFISWGDGQVILPPETKGTVNGLAFNLDYGWIWGQSASSQPLEIHLKGVDVHISTGKFALEQPANGIGWLYVFERQAEVLYNGEQASVKVGSGQMIAMVDGAKPFPMASVVATALHPTIKKLPVFEIMEPSISARIQNWLVKTGIGAMQTITFITYILSLVTLITIPVLVLFSYRKKRRISSNSQENH